MQPLVVARPNMLMVGMGQAESGRDKDRFSSILGSCVAVCLYSRRQLAGAIAHIVMPNSQGTNAPPGKSVDTAIPHLLDLLARDGILHREIEARIAGGASMFMMSPGGLQIGQTNIAASIELLERHRIPIVGQETGGRKGRRIVFDCSDGRVAVEVIGESPRLI